MGKGRTSKKRKKKEEEGSEVDGDSPHSEESSNETEEDKEKSEESKYTPYFVTDYTRRYPEDSLANEFVVFVESSDKNSIGTRDLLSLSGCLKRFNKGVKYLRSLNKFKIGVFFEKASLANAFLNNKTFLTDYHFKASIPANSTEITGIIRNVPINISNKKIYTMLSSTKKIICIRRFLQKRNLEFGFVRQPTQTVAITFAASVLPDYVDLEGWRHDILQYVPPVKQCYQCLRYGHLSKFCKNGERCSICTKDHNYKNCTTPMQEAICVHCKGNHISISGACPIKQQKILENKRKYEPKPFADLLDNKNFPALGKNKKTMNLEYLLKSDPKILSVLVESIVKIVTLNKSKEFSICSKNVHDIILQTIQGENKHPQNSPQTN